MRSRMLTGSQRALEKAGVTSTKTGNSTHLFIFSFEKILVSINLQCLF